MFGNLLRTSSCKTLIHSKLRPCCINACVTSQPTSNILDGKQCDFSYSKRFYFKRAYRLSHRQAFQVSDVSASRILCRKASRLLKQNLGNSYLYNHRKCLSDFKNDDLVKSWLSEIKEDFEKERTNQSSLSDEKDVTKQGVGDMSKSDIGNDIDKTKSSAELQNLENKWAETLSVVEESSSDSSDSSSESDSDVNEQSSEVVSNLESSSDRVVTDVNNELDDDLEKLNKHGFTAEEIIELMRRTKLSDIQEEEHQDETDTEHSIDEVDASNGSRLKNNEKHHTDNSEYKMKSSENDISDSNDTNVEDFTEKSNWSVIEVKDAKLKTDWSVVEIEDFVNITEEEPDVAEPWQAPVELIRGTTGVFDIEDMVEVLRCANVADMAVVSIPPQADFADYMVIVSAKSVRHMKAIAADVRWIFKRRMCKTDRLVKIEGEGTDWYAMDLGNIVLHIFMPQTRDLYDLETLWTVGPKYDPLCTEQANPYVFSAGDLPWLEELEQSESTK